MIDDETNGLKPGQFSDGGTPDVNFIEQFRKEEGEFRRRKIALIDNLAHTKAITPQYAQLLHRIHTSTLGAEGATLRKVEAVIAMREVLKAEGIAQKYSANMGAATDWEFPVALGAREIVMVDSDYGKGNTAQQLFDSVRSFDSQAIMTDGDNPDIRFNVDIGEGKEGVLLHLNSSEITKYQPDRPLGLVVEFAGPTKGSNTSRVPVISNVTMGMASDGLVYNLDYNDEFCYTPDIGMTQIEREGFHLYKVQDRDKMVTASRMIFEPARDGTLEQLRNIHASHLKSGNK